MWTRRGGVSLAVLTLALCAACAGKFPVVTESLDSNTGVTVSRTTAQLIFYHDNSAAAAHARDFVYLAPLAVNRMGEYHYYLWLGIWSAIDAADAPMRRDGFESIVIFADGEPLLLDVHGWAANSIGLSEPVYMKPVASATEAFYPVTADQIRLLAVAKDISLRAGASNSTKYLAWEHQKSARNALQEFAVLLQ